MTLTIEQRMQVYRVLDAEFNKAGKALAKAKTHYNSQPYGTNPADREIAAVLLSLREAQYKAAQMAASDYFDQYLKD